MTDSKRVRSFKIRLLAALAAASLLAALPLAISAGAESHDIEDVPLEPTPTSTPGDQDPPEDTTPTTTPENTDDIIYPIVGQDKQCVFTDDPAANAAIRESLLNDIVKARANLSRHHGAVFIEWNIVHRSDVGDHPFGELPESFQDTLDLQGIPERPQLDLDVLPTEFGVQRSDDGGNTWSSIVTVRNEPDRFVADVEAAAAGADPAWSDAEKAWHLVTLLNTLRTRGRQLTHYDTTITWPPRYPGNTYDYRVAIRFTVGTDAGCSVHANIASPIEVEDPTPTTCVGADVDEAELRAIFKPASELGKRGWNVSWKSVTAADAAHADATPSFLPGEEPPGGLRALPNFVVQRTTQTGPDAYFSTVGLWANDGTGKRSAHLDSTAGSEASYTYRLVAVYGEDCGVTFTMDPLNGPPLECTGNMFDATSRELRRELTPRRSLANARGVVVSFFDIPGIERIRMYKPQNAVNEDPTNVVVQRQSVSASRTPVLSDDAWVTLASYPVAGTGKKQKFTDAFAAPGHVHYYRMVVVYDDNCGVVTRPTNLVAVDFPTRGSLINASPSLVTHTDGTQRVRVTLTQMYWAGAYVVTRAPQVGSQYDESREVVVGYYARLNNRANRTVLDLSSRVEPNAPGNTVQSQQCYRVTLIDRNGNRYSNGATSCVTVNGQIVAEAG